MKSITTTKKPFDFLIFLTVLIMLTIGSIMVFSSSAPHAYNYLKGDSYHFLKKQLLYVPAGLCVMFVTMNIDYRKLGKLSPIIMLVSLGMLSVVWIDGIGATRNNATRWFDLGFVDFQPSEFAKLAMILFLSYSLSKRQDTLKYFFKGLVPYLILIGVHALLLLLQPHMSATIIIGLVSCVILFCAGAKIKHFVLMGVPAVAAVSYLIFTSEYRMNRVLSFLNPWNDPTGAGWQVIQSLYAIGSGGLFGRGLGNSLQKFLYIPEPYNDFILAVLAEELGFIGVALVLLLFLIFIWRGVKVSMNAPDVFGSLVAIGITSLIAFQAVINVAVVTSSMPVTGMPLPFFSYGGTSLIFLMAGVGILLNISRYSNYERI
ncbi:MAG TPA: putative lipid II flippase FtsW [Acetivibrio sp.]|uniref:putative lipid II flippase FtsW n=1 Tax=Acetivibrio sp. TaxID=1872092 RepID=UPI002C194417|nr:putative lipid II flippase FtsW [Acetivibrio sp.]HOM01199.1 putative lipid II flippase FtsW [Acetivibrio sp.]